MRGWILHNHFYDTPKFREQIGMYAEAAEREGILLEPVSNAEALAKLKKGRPDFALYLDKDLYLAHLLFREGIPLFNSAESVRLCDDKMLTYEHLLPTGVRMPKTLPVPLSFYTASWEGNPFIDAASEELGYPMVVKETHGSYGQQVRLAESREELTRMLGEISPVPALVQEYVAFSRGRDVRIEVVGSEAVAAMKRVSETDFRANLYSGGRAEAYEPNEEEKEIALTACRALGLTFGGVDLLFGEDGHPYLCEVNSNAHIRSLYLCTGVNSAEPIMREIRYRMSERGAF